MAEFKKLADKFGIESEGTIVDDEYIIELADSDEYSRVYTLLDNSSDVDINETMSYVSESNCNLVYAGIDFDVSLIANFDDEQYYVKFGEIQDEENVD